MTDRIPPQNLEAEKSVLGACMIENSVIPEVAAIISPADFYFPSHQTAYEAVLALADASQPVDTITVDNFLKAEPTHKVSAADLCAMVESALPSHAVQHARLVKNSAERRRLLAILAEAEEAAYSPNDDPAEVAARIGSRLAHVGTGAARGFVRVSEVVVTTMKGIEKNYERKNNVTGIPTGLHDLDFRLGGVYPGELMIIAGRPSMGKTALAATMATGAAERGHPVGFISVESPSPKIVQRMLSSASGIENRNIRRAVLNDADIQKLTTVAGRLGELPLWLLDSERRWERIVALIRLLKQRENIALAFVDYIGLISSPIPKAERYLQLGHISGDAKSLAVELDIAVVLLSQLNRNVEDREDKRPRLSDLRESGALEQDADIVFLLYRPVYYDPKFRPADLTEMNVLKNRDGATGIIKLRFDERVVSFSDWNEPAAARDFGEPRGAVQ